MNRPRSSASAGRECVGSELPGDGADRVVDVVLLWWREGDAG
ncbi:DUF3052 family protein [Streptomyces exfoliatus]